MSYSILPARISATLVACALAATPALAQSTSDQARMLARADANGDGVIALSEAEEARAKVFARLDRNEDGFIDSSDRPRLLGRGKFDDAVEVLMQTADSNRDERISRSEYDASRAAAFERTDINGDSAIDRDELASLARE